MQLSHDAVCDTAMRGRHRRAAQYVGGRVQVSLDPQPPWLRYKGKWGSTVVAPALQEWYVVIFC